MITPQFDYIFFPTVNLAAATDINITPFRVMPEIPDLRELARPEHLRHARLDIIHRPGIDARKPVRITIFRRRMIVQPEQLKHHIAGNHPANAGLCIDTNRPKPGITGIQDIPNPTGLPNNWFSDVRFICKFPGPFTNIIVMTKT